MRYDLADVVIKADRQCSCGRAFPVVERLVGREGDSITTVSGRQFGAAILTHLLYGTGNILESQIVQDAPDHVWIDYVPAVGFSSENLLAFERLIKVHLPSELRVEFRQVEAVERTASGKVRPVVSKIKAPAAC
jgi:phenylacetate-CoA ligase